MLGHNRRTDALDYLQSMLRELRTLAAAERCDMVAYLIEMAYVETSDIIRGERPMNVAQTLPMKTPMAKSSSRRSLRGRTTGAGTL